MAQRPLRSSAREQGWRQLTVAVTIVVIGVLLTTAPAFGSVFRLPCDAAAGSLFSGVTAPPAEREAARCRAQLP